MYMYVQVLDRLKVAVDFFHVNNTTSVELSHLQELFDVSTTLPITRAYSIFHACLLLLLQQGLDTLQRDFMNMMKRSSKPVPVAILNDIALCEDIEGEPLSFSPSLSLPPPPPLSLSVFLSHA